MAHIASYKELRVYQQAMAGAMRIFELTKAFPAEEKYSLTDQIRRASRSVCANIEYDQIIGQLVRMIDRPEQWAIERQPSSTLNLVATAKKGQ